MSNLATYGIGGLCCVSLLLLIILIPSSIRNVKFDEYAIKYVKITRKVDESEIYKEGKYVFSPSTKLFKYSNIVNKLEVKIPCLTSNGIVMQVQVDIQYQILENEVFNIFYTFGDPEVYEDFITIVSSDAIRDSCGDYTAEEFYLSRGLIQDSINSTVTMAFQIAEQNMNLPVITLRSYSFPGVLDNAIKNKRYAENDIEIANNERNGAVIEANTTYLEAEVNARQLLIQAQAEVDSTLAEANAQADAINELWRQRALFFLDVKESLGMAPDQFVDQYLTSLVLQTAIDPITDLDLTFDTLYSFDPTESPTKSPTTNPTNNPSMEPTINTMAPTNATR